MFQLVCVYFENCIRKRLHHPFVQTNFDVVLLVMFHLQKSWGNARMLEGRRQPCFQGFSHAPGFA